jgi:TRAP-type C4-dicarboxylate transport system substrate-binding protein
MMFLKLHFFLRRSKMRKIGLMLLVLSFSMVMLFANGDQETGSAKKPEVWRIAHSSMKGDIIDIYCNEFAAGLENAFPNVDVQVFPSGQLGDYVAQQELLQGNGLEFAMLCTDSLALSIPEMQIAGLNFVWSDDRSVNQKAMSEGDAFAKLDDLLLKQGLVTIDWVNEDFRCWTSNRPIHTSADFSGMKIRVYPTPLRIASYEVLDANPTPIPFAEVYSALQLKMADAQENPILVIEQMKFFEVQDYLILSNHSCVTNTLQTNTMFWNKFSEEEKNIIMNIKQKVSESVFNQQEKLTNDALSRIQAEGGTEIITLTDKQRDTFVQANAPIVDDFEKYAGKDAKKLLDVFIKDIQEIEK